MSEYSKTMDYCLTGRINVHYQKTKESHFEYLKLNPIKTPCDRAH